MLNNVKAHGKIVFASGNLVKISFEGNVSQGEIGFIELEKESLKCEIIEIEGKIAKAQVFEDTAGIKLHTPVHFTKMQLEVELGPGLIAQIFDGLQNPLEEIAAESGIFLPRGLQLHSLNRSKTWGFQPIAKVGEILRRGDVLGTVKEFHLTHQIFLPFSFFGVYKVSWISEPGNFHIDTIIAKVIDEKNNAIDISMVQRWPVKIPLIEGTQQKATKPLITGLRVIDTMIPLLKGGTACNPGPFGAGKTVTQQLISKHSNVDIVIIVACGERAGEVVETLKTFPKLMDVHSDEPLMHRTVLICNTSSMPVAARESSIYVGVTIAEYFRQMSLDVLLLADSTSRWAQAMREISGRLEEMPGDEAFPAYLQSRIFSFYERAGVISLSSERGEGSVTILGAVSPAGGNMNEPVVQATQNVVGAFICLSRALSEKRIYPSIDPLLSWSTYEGRFNAELEETQVPDWGRWIYNTRQCLRDGDEIARRLEVVGEEGIPLQDMIIYLKSNFISFCYLQQNAFDKEDIYSSLDRQKVQFAFINEVLDQKFVFDTHDKARSWFLEFQTEVKNLNFLKFGSDAYKESLAFLKEKIKNKAEEPLEISHAEVL